MEHEGIVSLWVGRAASRDALDDALAVEFSEEGDFVGSPFSRGFAIDYYDEGDEEAEYAARATPDLSELLGEVSYDDVIVPQLARIERPGGPFNCFVLLFDHRHEGPERWEGPGISMQFWGTAAYR
jgi:hypothetical protein